MKRPILSLSISILVISIAFCGYTAIRSALTPADAGASTAGMNHPRFDVSVRHNGEDTRPTAPVSSASKADKRPSPGVTLADTGSKTGSSRGIASFYRVRTNGTRTASGVPLKDSVSTAAHRTLPFGTRVRVTNLSNRKSETLKITDRGPFIKGRIIDVSLNAAKKLGMIEAGIVSVEVEVLPESPKPKRPSLVKD